MIKLFISQPMHGYDTKDIIKKRKTLLDLFIEYKGLGDGDVFLIDQVNPFDPMDADENFESEDAHRMYRLCRSIGMMKGATYVIMYGNWREARGCQIEYSILTSYNAANVIDENELIDYCVKNAKIGYINILWPEKAHLFRNRKQVKNRKLVKVAAVSTDKIPSRRIIASKDSGLPEGSVLAFREPVNGIYAVNIQYSSDFENYPLLKEFPECVYVSRELGYNLVLDFGGGERITLVVPTDDDDEPSEEEIQRTIDNIYPLTIISDRYSGTYSGGEFTAWCCGRDFIPTEISEDDVICAHGWGELKAKRNNGEIAFGIGDTPDEAIRDLAIAMIRNSRMYEEE